MLVLERETWAKNGCEGPDIMDLYRRKPEITSTRTYKRTEIKQQKLSKFARNLSLDRLSRDDINLKILYGKDDNASLID